MALPTSRRAALLFAGIALLCAAGALASVAQAAPQFKAAKYPVTIHGSGKVSVLKLGTTSNTVVCQSAFHGQLSAASSTLRLAVAWTECKALGFLSATANTEGCEYVMHATEEVTADEYKAHLSLECPAGKTIKVAVPLEGAAAAAEYKSQAGMTTVRLKDKTAATPVEDIAIDFEVTGVHHTVTKEGLWFSGTGEKTDGEITSSEDITLTGQNPGNPSEKIGIKVHDPVKEHEAATHAAETAHEAATEHREEVEHEEHTLSTSYPEKPQFTGSKYPVTIHGSALKGEILLTSEGGVLECDSSFHAELSEDTSTLDLSTNYTNCKAFGYAATVNTEGCGYRVHAASVKAKDQYKSYLGFKCPLGKSIKVTAGPCTIEIKEQTGLEELLLTSSTGAVDTFWLDFEGIVYSLSVTQDGVGCPFKSLGEKGGAIIGSVKLTGQSPSNPEEKIGVEFSDPVHEAATQHREDVEHEEHTLSTAHPEPPRFTAAKYPATIHGSSTKGYFDFYIGGGGVISCSNSFHGEIGKVSSTLDLTTTFTGCEKIAGSSTTVAMEGCSLRLHATSVIAKDKYESRFGIKCPIGQSIKVSAGPCALEIKEQVASWPSGESVQLLNMPSATPVEDVTFNPEISGVSFIATKDEAGCPLSGLGEKDALILGSSITLTGQNPSNSSEKIGFRVS